MIATTSLSVPGLTVALLLPWVCGAIWASWLLQRTGRCNLFITLGQGYFLGVFFTTVVIRLWDAVGLQLSFWPLAAVIALTAMLGLLLKRRCQTPATPQQGIDVVPRWHIVVCTVLLMLIAWRYITMLQEILLRPLFAWDAWMNWAPKAITWFYHGNLVEFVSPQQWWQGGAVDAYTLGNPQATHYPITVPLIQLWSMLGAGTWDDGAVYLPWLLAPLAMGLAIFGHLRLAGVPFVVAVIGLYLLLNLPYLNVHSVLVGYADSWLACAFALAVCALYEWRRQRHWAYGLLVLVLALLCSQLKVPGIVLGLIVLGFGLLAWLKLSPGWEIFGLVMAGLLVAALLIVGVDVELPYIGRILLETGVVDIGRFGRFELEYHAVSAAFMETLMLMINWNILWYGVALFTAFCCLPRTLFQKPPLEVLPVLVALGFVVFVFVFTKHYRAALNFITLNRALLYVVPALIFCCFLSFRRREL